MSAPADEARPTLEDALSDIEGLARVLIALGDHPDTAAIGYCGSRLLEHHHAAHDAFCRIYELDDYRPVEKAAVADPAALATRQPSATR